MNDVRPFRTFLAGLLVMCALAAPAAAQTVADAGDDTTLEQIIFFGRHGVRSPTATAATRATYAVDPFPDFGVPPGYLTPHGREAAGLLGSYFRAYLLHERLLTGNARLDLANSHYRANSIQRSNVTAAEFGAGLIPGITIPVHSYPLGQVDPVFDPLGGNVATVDPARAEVEVKGVFGDGSALAPAFGVERSFFRSVLFAYPQGLQPPPATPAGLVDAMSVPFLLSAGTTNLVTGNVIAAPGLDLATNAVDPFVMEYADGLPLDQVGWGRLSPDAVSMGTRFVTLALDVVMRTPYLARVQSSNAASHILRSMEQAVRGERVRGAFGDAWSRTIVVVSSDAFVAGLAGLLRLHWALPGYQPDYCAPGGALVFELRRSRRTRRHVVRAYYTAQTLDQLRNLTRLTLEAPPATMQLRIPVEADGADPDSWHDGGSRGAPGAGQESAPTLDVGFDEFRALLQRAIDRRSVQDPREETPPGVLTGVPLQ